MRHVCIIADLKELDALFDKIKESHFRFLKGYQDIRFVSFEIAVDDCISFLRATSTKRLDLVRDKRRSVPVCTKVPHSDESEEINNKEQFVSQVK